MRYFVVFLFGLFFSNFAVAEDVTIEMLNKLDKRNMVFSLEIVKINSGDTVFWKATDKGHNVEFISKGGVPDGVEKFKSKVGKDIEFNFTIPGIYAYWCTPPLCYYGRNCDDLLPLGLSQVGSRCHLERGVAWWDCCRTRSCYGNYPLLICQVDLLARSSRV